MSLVSHVLQRQLQLPAPRTRRVAVDRDLRVPMRDGVELLADRWAPKVGADRLPTALVRSPYGRAGVFGLLMARTLAERGYQVLIQSVRGGFGSGGVLDPMRQEREDGLDTLDWVVKQPWFGDSMVLVGMSYLGYVQWAVADSLPPEVKAMIPVVTESALTREFMRADGRSLELPFEWGAMVATQERPLSMFRRNAQAKKTERAMRVLPLQDADLDAIGSRSQYIQDVLAYDADDPHWDRLDHRHRVAATSVPVSSVTGWYDIFLPGQLRDFRVLQDAGKAARLTVGPWTHAEPMGSVVTEAIDFGLAHARGEEPPERAPVRLFVMGQDEWRDFESWPPKGYEPQRLHLQADGALSVGMPDESEPDTYRYDPADPTPAAGGISISHGGRVENGTLEARPDVLTYTTAVLEDDVEVVGEVSAEVWFRSSLAHADVFVRLCDVDEQGRSHNVCDGLTSLASAEELTRAEVGLWPTAYRFKSGHRIRVQVSSGAFPRYARNSGTGEPIATATTLRAADQAVYHDPEHPSALFLPVRSLP
ncbi:CocE/NonD family hydrolase [Antribacter sp. KLBMP9083]|uniref:CocE/NonD family hydrolase n=1 Tax=Antribacter soli TaxID=2910976 RepID=A0AA41QD02_9MICO|nr:CocE/NonD family hydrolase [Antribacter soli]MCF4119889.1 CocE/NonD family hydrolase [Antribacter soli]